MAGSGTDRFGSSAQGTALQMPVMGNAMQYINPFYTQAQPDNSLSPLAMFQQFQRTGIMPQEQSSFAPFVAPQMPRIAMETFTRKPVASSGGGLIGGYGGDSGGGDFGDYGGGYVSGVSSSSTGYGNPGESSYSSSESGVGNPGESYGGDPGGYGGDSGGDGGGWAKGGKVTRNRLTGPNPAGPDDGYGALDDGEYVLKADMVKKLGVKALKALNEGRATIVMKGK